MAHPSRQSTPRPAIADLLKVARAYKFDPSDQPTGSDMEGLRAHRFVLVNEMNHDFLRDELILMIGLAYPEFVSLVQEMETLYLELETAKGVAVKLYRSITGSDDLTPQGANGAETMMAFYKQSWDVIKSLAHNVSADKCKPVAMRHYERAKAFLEPPENILVNEKIVQLPPDEQVTPTQAPENQG